MKRTDAVSVGLVLCIGLIALPARSAENMPVVGTWQPNGYSQEFLDTNEVIRPFGD